MQKSKRPPLPLADFQRVFQVAHGIADELAKDVSKSCLLINMIGAVILGEHYKRDARPVAGAAFYKLDTSDRALAIADPAEGFEKSSPDGFHCWVEVDDWCIDFTSPLFPEMASHFGEGIRCDRKMFQKPRSAMSESFDDLLSPGDFFLNPDRELSLALLSKNLARNDVKDLLHVASVWYQKPPRKFQRAFQIQSDEGKVISLSANAPLVTGAW
ncbi:DUF2026 family protein [Pandoraea sp. ISTKB]|uniref:DUF2026 family protein n=1 Tax=Pandoraea sp. ISTKB TaxID=1586708 RepID=UPI00084750A3|nr:DUF2026 family protein [Pandoraea sp. ISTKB]ODP35111.1 hypothetical protein A9762_12170 [Pandoraea sp. ISTKB]